MTLSAGKLAPSAVVLAFVVYCTWPSVPALLSHAPPPESPEKVSAISALLFSPKMPAPPERNPWGGMDAATLASLGNAKNKNILSDLADNLAKSLAKTGSTKQPLTPVDLLKELTLGATCIGERQRLAIINDRIYALHQTLSEPNREMKPCKIIEVRPHEVLLEYEGKTLELKYSDMTPSSAKDNEEAAIEESAKMLPVKAEAEKPSPDANSSTKKTSKVGM